MLAKPFVNTRLRVGLLEVWLMPRLGSIQGPVADENRLPIGLVSIQAFHIMRGGATRRFQRNGWYTSKEIRATNLH